MVQRRRRDLAHSRAQRRRGARLRESSRTSKRGFAEECVCIFGGSGEPGKTASKNYAIVAYRSSMRRWRPARPRASGECQDTRRSNRRCATAISTRSVSPESTRPPKLNSIEPPRYGSVCQVVWEGRCREASPYPDLGWRPGAPSKAVRDGVNPLVVVEATDARPFIRVELAASSVDRIVRIWSAGRRSCGGSAPGASVVHALSWGGECTATCPHIFGDRSNAIGVGAVAWRVLEDVARQHAELDPQRFGAGRRDRVYPESAAIKRFCGKCCASRVSTDETTYPPEGLACRIIRGAPLAAACAAPGSIAATAICRVGCARPRTGPPRYQRGGRRFRAAPDLESRHCFATGFERKVGTGPHVGRISSHGQTDR